VNFYKHALYSNIKKKNTIRIYNANEQVLFFKIFFIKNIYITCVKSFTHSFIHACMHAHTHVYININV